MYKDSSEWKKILNVGVSITLVIGGLFGISAAVVGTFVDGFTPISFIVTYWSTAFLVLSSILIIVFGIRFGVHE